MGADLYINSIAEKNRAKNSLLFDLAVQKRNNLGQHMPKIVRDALTPWGYDEKLAKKAKYLFPKEFSKYKKAQDDVEKYYLLSSGGEGYFRCSYGYNFFSNLGFSWWRDFSQLLDSENYLSVDAAIDLIAILENNENTMPSIETLKENHCKVDNNNSPFMWLNSFIEHKNEFIEFLYRAVELNEKIYCSI